jgi:hypothetical protein
MSSNFWAIKLKKTGFLEKHLDTEQSKINELEEKQMELRRAEIVNNTKIQEYKNRLSSLVVDAIAGQQGKLTGQK